MTKIIEKHVKTILRPTGINLAPYVVNPYQGCAMGCLFCYAQFSKVAQNEKYPWGNYVKVKINALKVLETELKMKNPDKVLLGSTTELFQDIEKQYRITRDIIRLLNQQKITYVIMSRALLIDEYIDELNKDLCEGIYFTVDTMPQEIRQQVQPQAVSMGEGIKMVNKLNDHGLKTTAYFCPIMPYFIEDLKNIDDLKQGTKAEFEILNFQMAGIKKIIKIISKNHPDIAEAYKRMCVDQAVYDEVITGVKNIIKKSVADASEQIIIHAHGYQDYFKNIYR